MTGSAAEEEIRDAVVARLRQLFPGSRIVHELNTSGHGSARIDVAAVCDWKIIGVEIKSERDTLARLQDQWTAFNACCQNVVVVAHRKHFVAHRNRWQSEDAPPVLNLNHPLADQFEFQRSVWCYPEPTDLKLDGLYYGEEGWSVERDTWRRYEPKPGAVPMLSLLWRDELSAECARHRISVGKRAIMAEMICEMQWLMTGKEICHAVCRQLRQREFARADEPVREAA